MQAETTNTTGPRYPAPTGDTIDQLDGAVERVEGVQQIIFHGATSDWAVLPEALNAMGEMLISALRDLKTVRDKLNGKVAQ